MSYLYGTQMECFYSMPASGSAVTAAAITVLNGSTAANPEPLLPAGFFAQGSGNGPGKAIYMRGGGWFTVGTTAVTTAFTVGLDTTAGTLATTLGKTGTITTIASVSDGIWEFEFLLTCTAVGTAGTTGTLQGFGNVTYSAGNNAQTGTMGTFGTTNSTFCNQFFLGAPQSTISFTNTTNYYLDVYNTWSATTGSPTITMTNYYIFGLN